MVQITFYHHQDDNIAKEMVSYLKKKGVEEVKVEMIVHTTGKPDDVGSRMVAVDDLKEMFMDFMNLPFKREVGLKRFIITAESIDTEFYFTDNEETGSSSQEDFEEVFGKYS